MSTVNWSFVAVLATTQNCLVETAPLLFELNDQESLFVATSVRNEHTLSWPSCTCRQVELSTNNNNILEARVLVRPYVFVLLLLFAFVSHLIRSASSSVAAFHSGRGLNTATQPLELVTLNPLLALMLSGEW
jgi:hypothetical protein